MSKIKDLATVTVDNAFMLFPVNRERYELADLVESWAIAFMVSIGTCERQPLPHSQDERINRFLVETNKTFHRAACSVFRVQAGLGHSTRDWDLYRRVLYALHKFHYESEGFDPGLADGDIVADLWSAFCDAFKKADA